MLNAVIAVPYCSWNVQVDSARSGARGAVGVAAIQTSLELALVMMRTAPMVHPAGSHLPSFSASVFVVVLPLPREQDKQAWLQ